MSQLLSPRIDILATDPALVASANANALNRLVRCLFAERLLAPEALLWSRKDQQAKQRQAWLPLWNTRRVLHFKHLHAAPAGTLQNRGEIEILDAHGNHLRIDHPDALLDEIESALAITPAPDGLTVLKRDINDSINNDILARRHRNLWIEDFCDKIAKAGSVDFLDYLYSHLPTHLASMLLDQWGSLEGHPFYPTWKAKPNLQPSEVAALSPEFGAKVPLRLAALRKDWAYVEKMPHVVDYHHWFASAFPELYKQWSDHLTAVGKTPADWLPLPIHSWHLEHFVAQEFAPEIERGALLLDGPDIVTLPSMSFRTMLPDDETLRPFIKLPVAIWLTSEQRSLQAKSIHMGPRLSTLISTILADEPAIGAKLEIFTEELGAILHDPATGDEHRGRFLSVVYRNADVLGRTDGKYAITVAALLSASPKDGRPILCELIARYCLQNPARSERQNVQSFLRRYAEVVVQPALAMYLLYGIAFEAHQQNTTILFDPSGAADKLIIRDFGDGRSYAPLLTERGYHLKPFQREGILPTTFDGDISLVRSFLIDACFICHLHEIALCLSAQYGFDDDDLWMVIKEVVIDAFDTLRPRVTSEVFWQEERDALLEKPWPTRSVLTMHLERYKDYRVEHTLPNPLVGR
jgi:siderophore synthetase component